jgi:hypothetical protein
MHPGVVDWVVPKNLLASKTTLIGGVYGTLLTRVELHGERRRHLVPIILVLDGLATVDLSPGILPVVASSSGPSLYTGFYRSLCQNIIRVSMRTLKG